MTQDMLMLVMLVVNQVPTEAEQQTRILVNMLFARFKAIYTHKFASAYSTTDEVKLAER